MKLGKKINNNTMQADQTSFESVRLKHKEELSAYSMSALQRLGITGLLVGVVFVLQILLRPNDVGSYLIILLVVMAIDAYTVYKKTQPLALHRTLKTCGKTLLFLLSMSYLWAFFGWLGLFASVAGYLLISVIIAMIMVFRNKDEWMQSADMIARMIKERRKAR